MNSDFVTVRSSLETLGNADANSVFGSSAAGMRPGRPARDPGDVCEAARRERMTGALPGRLGRSAAMTLSRIAWLTTVGICLVGAVLLFIAGYQGYGLLAICVGAAAGLNLR
jgi:hypothetical protein